MKNVSAAVLLTVVIGSCNLASSDKKTMDDSLQFYPPTPGNISRDEFRQYYRTLTAFFDTTLLGNGFSGEILVAKNGNILYEHYQGRRDLRQKDSINAQTPLHIASTSKTFTAIAILRLVQEGQLLLTDTLTKFFPAFPYPGITVQMLLSHRSGLPNYLYFLSNAKWDKDPKGKWNHRYATNQDVLDFLISKKPDLAGTPGKRFNYCNTNFVLLALIIEKLTGKSYPDYMHDKWFAPLQMNNSYVFTLNDTLTATPSFTPSGSYWALDFLDGTYGDKNIYTTARDLLKWDQALYSGQILRTGLLDSAFAPYSFEKPSMHNYGLGWRLLLLPNGKKIIYHFGKWHGFNAAFARLTDEKATIIILGNRFTRSIYSAANLCYDIFGEYGQKQAPDPEENDPAATNSVSGKKTKKSGP